MKEIPIFFDGLLLLPLGNPYLFKPVNKLDSWVPQYLAMLNFKKHGDPGVHLVAKLRSSVVHADLMQTLKKPLIWMSVTSQ